MTRIRNSGKSELSERLSGAIATPELVMRLCTRQAQRRAPGGRDLADGGPDETGRLSADRDLARHIALVLVAKLMLLGALWCVCVRPYQVTVDPGQAAARLTGSVSAPLNRSGGQHDQ